MSPQVLVVRFAARPGAEDRLEQALRALARGSRAEPGCLAFAVHRGAIDGGAFLLYEQWATAEALEAHAATGHAQAFQQQARELLDHAPDVTSWAPCPP